MARQKGLIKYEGNLGGVSHYRQKGVKDHLARIANGPSAEQIASDPAFQRTRENNAEFKGCALVGKNLRQSFAKLIRSAADPFITGRLVGVMKQINLQDSVNARGQRSVAISLGAEKLKDFQFNRGLSLDTIFSPPYALTSNAAKNEATLTVQPFTPIDTMDVPAGATHFRIILAIGSLSDYAYDAIYKAYSAVEPDEDGLNVMVFSAYLPVDQDVSAAIPLTASLPGAPTLSATTGLATAIGIEYYQEVNGVQYLFAQGNAAKFAEVFV